MDAPPIRYAQTSDGVSIAYWALGQGAPLVQLPALPHSHIGVEWELSEFRRGYELAASARTMVRYDGRGTGLSQRDVEDFSLGAMIADLDAVVGDLGAEQVALAGVINSSPIAIAYAARYPERVSHLLLWCPVVDCSVHVDNPQLQAARQIMETDWELYSLTVAHSLAGWSEPEAARRFAELIRAGITQTTARALVPAMHQLNATDELSRVRCPTRTRATLIVVGDTLIWIGFMGEVFLGTLIGGLGVLLFSLAILRTRIAARWVAWLGFAVAATGWTTALGTVAEVFELIELIGFVGLWVWMVALGVAVWRAPEHVSGPGLDGGPAH